MRKPAGTHRLRAQPEGFGRPLALRRASLPRATAAGPGGYRRCPDPLPRRCVALLPHVAPWPPRCAPASVAGARGGPSPSRASAAWVVLGSRALRKLGPRALKQDPRSHPGDERRAGGPPTRARVMLAVPSYQRGSRRRPPPPPLPPRKPPDRSGRGRASLTVKVRPPNSRSCSCAIAFWASSSVAISTNAKPARQWCRGGCRRRVFCPKSCTPRLVLHARPDSRHPAGRP